jgi:hypothetical protein
MTSKGSLLGQFLRALKAGNLMAAVALAHDMPRPLPLVDALELCRLLAEAEDPMFPRAASRWLARFSDEEKATLSQVQLAAAALGHLWEEPTSAVTLQTLKKLLSV